eukprot:9529852-Karenia_brevis.AAC.1
MFGLSQTSHGKRRMPLHMNPNALGLVQSLSIDLSVSQLLRQARSHGCYHAIFYEGASAIFFLEASNA